MSEIHLRMGGGGGLASPWAREKTFPTGEDAAHSRPESAFVAR
jgi:hypothetical protein